MTVTVDPVRASIERTSSDPETQELIDLFNALLAKTHAALTGYNAVREELRAKFGDQSCLADLGDRLTSLNDNCLASLGEGLGAVTQGDLTVHALPITNFLQARNARLGELGEAFNAMLATAQGGLESYNTMRLQLADVIRNIAESAGRVATSAHEMTSSAQQMGAATQEIAQAAGDVALGAEKQADIAQTARHVTREAVDVSRPRARSPRRASS